MVFGGKAIAFALLLTLSGCGKSSVDLVHCSDAASKGAEWQADPVREPISHRFVLLWDGSSHHRLDLASGALLQINSPDELVDCTLAANKPLLGVGRADAPFTIYDCSTSPPQRVLQSTLRNSAAEAFARSGDLLAFIHPQEDGKEPWNIIVWNLETDTIEANIPDAEGAYAILWRDDDHFLLKSESRVYNEVSRTNEGWQVTARPAIAEAPGRLEECFLGDHLVIQSRGTLHLPAKGRIVGCGDMDAFRLDASHILVACGSTAAIYTQDVQLSTFVPHEQMTRLAVQIAPNGWFFVYASQRAIWRVSVDEQYQWGEPERVAELPSQIRFRRLPASP